MEPENLLSATALNYVNSKEVYKVVKRVIFEKSVKLPLRFLLPHNELNHEYFKFTTWSSFLILKGTMVKPQRVNCCLIPYWLN
jgi:hypothetical protein